MFGGATLATFMGAGMASGGPDFASIGLMLGMGVVGLSVTVGSIAGIVVLARGLRKEPRNAGASVMMVIGIVGLVGFALAGLAATGCGVMLARW